MFFWSVHHSVTRVLAWFLFRNKSLSRDLSSLQCSLDKNFKCYWYIYIIIRILIPALVWGKCYRNPPPILGAKNDGFSIDFSISGIRVSKSWVAAHLRPSQCSDGSGWTQLLAGCSRTAACGPASELRYHWLSLHPQNQWFSVRNCIKLQFWVIGPGWVMGCPISKHDQVGITLLSGLSRSVGVSASVTTSCQGGVSSHGCAIDIMSHCKFCLFNSRKNSPTVRTESFEHPLTFLGCGSLHLSS